MTVQSVLDSASTQSHAINVLLWSFVALLSVIFVIVIALMLGALKPRRRAYTERNLTTRVTWATAATVIILFGLIVVSIATGKTISNPREDLTIEIAGNQWWWQVRYMNADPSRVFTTANEMHIPVGKNVALQLQSRDVIHSFWAPNLQGKRDLIPSRINMQWIRADRPGKFRAQCAEFCGLDHALMAMWVIAEPEDQFEQWYNAQLASAVEPDNDIKRHGRQVFLDHACAMCHNIQGTPANGQVAPDLTHFASRSSIAAGTLPNTKGYLAGWIADPQNIKPGNHMATVALTPADMQPLLEYLESLR